MEEGLERLEEDIGTAKDRHAEQRARANPEAAAGDWDDESAGAQQGDDAVDAEGAEGPGEGGEGGQGAIAEAPVHEAERVEPGGSAEGGAVADAPVHEAERVEPGDPADEDD